jgi:acetyltransferase-like isoleucine patch superfamily enzyme
LLSNSTCTATPGGHRDPQYLHETISNEKCTHLFFVPSLLTVLLEHLSLERAAGLTGPKHVFCVGEALLPQTAALFFGAFAGAELHNLYGPTEADMTYFQIPRGGVGARARVPAGAPIENSEVYVLDRYLDPVPLGLPGEMCFGGVGTARGYLNLPELTGKSFVANAYGPGRLYRTGDVGRWSHDRTLEYLGRLDHQVKLRGFRIELGEIESQIRRVDDRVTAVTAVVLGDNPATQRLVAYVTPASVRPREIIAALRRELPEYSVPSTVVPLAKMPLNPNGKVDRRALPPPESILGGLPGGGGGAGGGGGGGGGGAMVAPRTNLEAAVREVWAEVLGLDPAHISVDADFAAVGGNSLLTGKATSRVRAHVGARIPGTAMYQHPTIEGLCWYIEEHGLAPAVLGDGTGRGGGGGGGGGGGVGGGGSRGGGSKGDGGGGGGGDGGASSSSSSGSPPDPRARWLGKDARAPLAMGFQLAGAAVCCAIEAVFHILEWMVILYLYTALPTTALFFAVPFVPLLILLAAVALCVGIKWAVLGTVKPGRYRVWGWFYLRWWFVRNVVKIVEHEWMGLTASTEMASVFWRLLGAQIGDRVDIQGHMFDPDLVSIGDDAVVGRDANVVPFAVENGEIRLGRCRVGRSCSLAPRAMVTAGTSLPDGVDVGPLSTTDGVGPTDVKPRRSVPFARRKTQDLLRCCVGIPVQLVLHALPYVPLTFLLEAIWEALENRAGLRGVPLSLAFAAVCPWVIRFVYSEVYFLLVVAVKWLVIGAGAAGARGSSSTTEWGRFKRWLLERLIESGEFEAACKPWINTEILSIKFRMMGSSVGHKVQMDYFHAIEHEHVIIGDDVVFGSNVFIETTSDVGAAQGGLAVGERKPVKISNGANILDHCTMMPGVAVMEGAVLGSSTLAAEQATFPPFSVSTGNVGGRSVLLQRRSAAAAIFGGGGGVFVPKTDEQRMMVAAKARHDNFWWWLLFNVVDVIAVVVVLPLPQVVSVMSVAFDYLIYSHSKDSSGGGLSHGYAVSLAVALYPLLMLALSLAEVMVVCAFKWLFIGRYTEGNYPFYGTYHFKWIVMMAVMETTDTLFEIFNGSVYVIWMYRAFGSKIGENACLLGSPLEFDLLEVGECATVGLDCDVTCHTVEMMVIKLAPVIVGPGATIRNGSVLMPGGEMEPCSVLLDQSQVLKGETVPAGEVWAGLPAQPVAVGSGGGGGDWDRSGEALLDLDDIPLHEFEEDDSQSLLM